MRAPAIAARAQAGMPICPLCRQGLGAFADPGDLAVGMPFNLEFAVGETQQGLDRETGGRALLGTQSVYIAPNMRVTLQPHPAIKIDGPNGLVQTLSQDLRRASWQWNVTPLRKGSHTLKAQVEVLKPIGGGRFESIDRYSESVTLQVEVEAWTSFIDALGKAKTAGELFTALFKTWDGAFVALAAMIAAIGGVFTAIRNLGPKGKERRARRRQARATKKTARAARRSPRT